MIRRQRPTLQRHARRPGWNRRDSCHDCSIKPSMAHISNHTIKGISMNSFNVELDVTTTIAEALPMPHIYAIAQKLFKAIKPDHTDATMEETLRLVIPAEGRTGVYVAYLTGPTAFPVGAMLT